MAFFAVLKKAFCLNNINLLFLQHFLHTVCPWAHQLRQWKKKPKLLKLSVIPIKLFHRQYCTELFLPLITRRLQFYFFFLVVYTVAPVILIDQVNCFFFKDKFHSYAKTSHFKLNCGMKIKEFRMRKRFKN